MDDNLLVGRLNTGTDPWYQALFECSPQPMYIYDAETLLFLAVNEAAIRHYGFSRDEFLVLTTKDIRPSADVPALLKEIQELKSTRRTGFQKSVVRQHRLKDGSIIHVETARQLLLFNGRQAICVLVNDVSERVHAEQRIKHLAFFDELTGLPNRAKLRSDLQNAIAHAQRRGKSLALLVVELIRFREINYTLGHLIGDELLRQVGSRIREVAGEGAYSARISNVQFGVVLPNLSAGAAVLLTGRLLNALADPLAVGEISFELGAHGGIAFFPGHGSDPDALIRHADIALYQARKSGRSYTIYDAAHDPYNAQRLNLLGEFRRAIKKGQLQLYCQPKADIRTGTITSAEALVRWMHPDRGLILPDQFIPLIEPTELIQPLTYCMLEAAVRQCCEWGREGRMMPLAVNLSTRNLLDANLPEYIDDLLKTWGVDACWMGLEITESSIMADPVASIRVLTQLHQMGLKLFVDDFGTGYSSLSYLLKLPVDVIKIDHSFTMNMIEDPGAAAIVKSTIEMAHNMELQVIAEGTATRGIWESLARLGCDEAQGEYVSMPMPAMDFSAWLDRSSWAH